MVRVIRRFMFGADGLAGTALIEFTIIAPAMIVIFVGLTDAGLLIFRTMEVQHAAQAGAQYINVNGFSSVELFFGFGCFRCSDQCHDIYRDQRHSWCGPVLRLPVE